jgi:hypothetical protein
MAVAIEPIDEALARIRSAGSDVNNVRPPKLLVGAHSLTAAVGGGADLTRKRYDPLD